MNTNVDIGRRLREERERLQLRQDELADRLCVSRTSQSNYERGERSPDAAYLAAALEAGVDVLYVVTGARAGGSTVVETGDAAGVALTAQETALLDNYRHSDEAGKRAVEAAAAALAKPVRGGDDQAAA